MKLKNRKTGEIFHGNNIDLYTNKVYLEIIDKDGYPKNYDYNSLAELREEWGDYVPKEPLIKDDKIRKAVRAWAEANDIHSVRVLIKGESWLLRDEDTYLNENYVPEIKFYVGLGENPDFCRDKIYTIDELCGE